MNAQTLKEPSSMEVGVVTCMARTERPIRQSDITRRARDNAARHCRFQKSHEGLRGSNVVILDDFGCQEFI